MKCPLAALMVSRGKSEITISCGRLTSRHSPGQGLIELLLRPSMFGSVPTHRGVKRKEIGLHDSSRCTDDNLAKPSTLTEFVIFDSDPCRSVLFLRCTATASCFRVRAQMRSSEVRLEAMCFCREKASLPNAAKTHTRSCHFRGTITKKVGIAKRLVVLAKGHTSGRTRADAIRDFSFHLSGVEAAERIRVAIYSQSIFVAASSMT